MLFANRSPWTVAHHGRSERTAPGEAVLVDSEGELLTSAPYGFQGNIIKVPVNWLRTWLPEPELLLGRRITWDSRWGHTFLAMVGQLSPELATASPVPHAVLVDQLGVTLALVSNDFETRAMPEMLKKVNDCIRQRCTEPNLTATDVAMSLQISSLLLHQVLAASNLTFASQLLAARTDVAMQMLTSRSFTGLTTSEVGRQAGFSTESHFTRVVRKRAGCTPRQLRLGAVNARRSE